MSRNVSTPQTPSFWRRRVIAPLVSQLRQGTTPKMIAITVAAGCVLSLFPILGSTTLLCAVVAAAFGLNQPLIQTVNYLLYPAQIALLFPFYRAGEWLFQQPPVPLFSLTELTSRFWNSPGQFFVDYGLVAIYGIVAWMLVALPAFGLLVVILQAPIRALAMRMRRPAVASAAGDPMP